MYLAADGHEKLSRASKRLAVKSTSTSLHATLPVNAVISGLQIFYLHHQKAAAGTCVPQYLLSTKHHKICRL